MATWRKCCNFITKQIIGQYPSGESEAPKCTYIAFVDFYSTAYNNLYFDDAQTQPMFNDIYGNGDLMNLMNASGGNLYYSFSAPGDFIFSGCWLYYEGTSLIPSIPVYDNLGVNIATIDFAIGSIYGFDCTNKKCYTATYDNNFQSLYAIQWGTSPSTLSADFPSSNPFVVPDLFDTVTMDSLVKSIYGLSASYSYLDNGDGTATITIFDAYDWAYAPKLYLFDGSNFISLTFTECNP